MADNVVIVDQSFSKKTGQNDLALDNYNLPASLTAGTFIANILNVRAGLTPDVEPFYNYAIGGSALTGWTLLVGAIPPTVPTTVRLRAGGQRKQFPLYAPSVAVLGLLTTSSMLAYGIASSGSIFGSAAGSTITSNLPGLTVNSGLRTYNWDGSSSVGGSYPNALTETLSGAVGSPMNSPLSIVQVTLGTLSLSGAITNGIPSSGTIIGATTGSTIASNVIGLTVNSALRTYTWDGSGAAGTTSNGLVETLAGAIGSPKSNSITVAGTILTGTFNAPILTPQASATTYPPAPAYTFNPAHHVGDKVRIQTSSVFDFSLLGVNDNTVVLTGVYATDKAAINNRLAGISSGTNYIRARVERSDASAVSYWSNIVYHGSASVPTVTSSLTPTVVSTFPLAYTLTLSGPAYVELGGDDRALFQLDNTQPSNNYTLRFLNNVTKSYSTPADIDDFNGDHHYNVSFIVTGLQGASAETVIDVELLDYDTTPDDFTLSPISNAALDTDTDTIEYVVSGLVSGYAMSVAVSGMSLAKKPVGGSYGAFSTSATTMVNGDAFKLRKHSSTSYSTAVTGTLYYGPLTKTLTVTTMADPSSASLTQSATGPYTHDFAFGNGGTISLSSHTFGVGDWVIAVNASVEGTTHDGLTIGGFTAVKDAGLPGMSIWRVPLATNGGASGSKAVVMSVTGGISLVECLAYTGTHLGNIVSGSLQTVARGYGHALGGGYGEAVPASMSQITGGRIGFVFVHAAVSATFPWTGANAFSTCTIFDSNSGTDMNLTTAAVPTVATPTVAFASPTGYPYSGLIAFVWEKI